MVVKFLFEGQAGTSGSEIVVEDIQSLLISTTLKNLFEDLFENENVIEVPVPSDISPQTMRTVIRFCQSFKEKPFEIKEDAKSFIPKDWYLEFINNLGDDEIMLIIQTADFYNIHPLIHLLAYAIAQRLKGKNADQIREYMGLEDDFTPEEKDEALKELSFALTEESS